MMILPSGMVPPGVVYLLLASQLPTLASWIVIVIVYSTHQPRSVWYCLHRVASAFNVDLSCDVNGFIYCIKFMWWNTFSSFSKLGHEPSSQGKAVLHIMCRLLPSYSGLGCHYTWHKAVHDIKQAWYNHIFLTTLSKDKCSNHQYRLLERKFEWNWLSSLKTILTSSRT